VNQAPSILYGKGRRQPPNGYGVPGNPERDSATATRKPGGARWQLLALRDDGTEFVHGYALTAWEDDAGIGARDKFLHESVVAPAGRKRVVWCGKGEAPC